MTTAAMERIGVLLNEQRFAVLCTSTDGWPYAGLVAFAVEKELKRIYFATPENTQKTANLRADGRVALLVDNRTNRPEDCRHGMAVTILGHAEIFDPGSRPEAGGCLLTKHPDLAVFLDALDTVLVCIHVERYRLVEQFQHTIDVRP